MTALDLAQPIVLRFDPQAVVVQARVTRLGEGVVLWRRADAHEPYVVHRFRTDGGLYNGGYHADYRDAETDFANRWPKSEEG